VSDPDGVVVRRTHVVTDADAVIVAAEWKAATLAAVSKNASVSETQTQVGRFQGARFIFAPGTTRTSRSGSRPS
jgi:hypothetical protein